MVSLPILRQPTVHQPSRTLNRSQLTVKEHPFNLLIAVANDPFVSLCTGWLPVGIKALRCGGCETNKNAYPNLLRKQDLGAVCALPHGPQPA